MEHSNNNLESKSGGTLSGKRVRSPTPSEKDSDNSDYSTTSGRSPEKSKARRDSQTKEFQNGPAAAVDKEACTDTCHDPLSLSKVEEEKAVKRLESVVRKLKRQRNFMERKMQRHQQHMLKGCMHAQHPMYVATGSAIKQNQQLTNVMKENRRLKKINARLVIICKKIDGYSNGENEDSTW